MMNYFLKIPSSFFDSIPIVMLQQTPDGILHTDIYIKLLLRSLHFNGRLMRDEVTPLTEDGVATLLAVSYPRDFVHTALLSLVQAGLECPDGGYCMTNFELLTGSDRTAQARRIRALKKLRDNIPDIPDLCLDEPLPRPNVCRLEAHTTENAVHEPMGFMGCDFQ